MTGTEFEAMQRAWEEYPSQDNEGYVPDRGGFKAGWAACLRWVRARQDTISCRPHEWQDLGDGQECRNCRTTRSMPASDDSFDRGHADGCRYEANADGYCNKCNRFMRTSKEST